MKYSARTFQASKCQNCKSPLELPSVHFLCMHSFHVRCLQDPEEGCPVCAPEYRRVLDIKESMQSNDPETFFKLVCFNFNALL